MLRELRQKYPALNHSEFIVFVQNAYEAVRIGRKVELTFLNASFYVFTILTTIGELIMISKLIEEKYLPNTTLIRYGNETSDFGISNDHEVWY